MTWRAKWCCGIDCGEFSARFERMAVGRNQHGRTLTSRCSQVERRPQPASLKWGRAGLCVKGECHGTPMRRFHENFLRREATRNGGHPGRATPLKAKGRTATVRPDDMRATRNGRLRLRPTGPHAAAPTHGTPHGGSGYPTRRLRPAGPYPTTPRRLRGGEPMRTSSGGTSTSRQERRPTSACIRTTGGTAAPLRTTGSREGGPRTTEPRHVPPHCERGSVMELLFDDWRFHENRAGLCL